MNIYKVTLGMNIHIVLYSNNEPFDTTKRLTIDSVKYHTSHNVIIHDYNLEKISKLEWFSQIEHLPTIYNEGRRDGYYNCWKSFITRDVYNLMNEGDILYYVDSSQYYKVGFTENIDKLCEFVNERGILAGSVGRDVRNISFGCCNKLSIWDKIIPDVDNSVHLSKMHVLNSWFALKKCAAIKSFVDEWIFYSCYKDSILHNPLVTYHHTADQSIFNILVIKYKLPVFYASHIGHNENKNKNTVLQILNTASNINDYIITL